ncbi:MAG: iron complex outermembrane recepter protein [Bacteroidetes bacterium]|nr:MAG: iron complex outermembrane recepter protein [Bacteroidota bacterium]
MRIKIFLTIAALLFLFAAQAQKVTVIDDITGQVLTNVTIFNKSKNFTATTNTKGQIDITKAGVTDSLFFRHLGYKTMAFTPGMLKEMKFVVVMKALNLSLDAVVISANRWEQEDREIPHRIETISMQQIAFANPQTSADLLHAGGYAYIQKSQLAGGSPVLRGFATNRVMLVVDGVRMNNAIFRTGNLQNVISLDAASVESNEIMFGPGAVMYGSDAIGGVMDFHTLKPKFSDNGKTTFSGNVFGRISSANFEKSGHLDFNAGLKRWAFTTSLTWSDYDDLVAGSNGNKYYLRPVYQKTVDGEDVEVNNDDPQKQIYSGYSQFNALQRISFKPSAKWFFDYGFYYSETSDAPRYDRLYLTDDAGKLVNAEWYYGPQKWMMNRLEAKFTSQGKLADAIRIVAAHQLYEESRHDRKMNNARLRNQFEKVNAYSFNLDLDKKLGEAVSLFYGAEAIYNLVNSEANRIKIADGTVTPTNTRYPDGSSWQSYAAYVNLKWKPDPKWVLNAGLRYSYIALEADFDTTMFPFPFVHASVANGALNGSLGLTYAPAENWQFYTNLSSGFRSPNIDDLGKVFDSEPGSVVVPNAGLEPEYALNAEAGTAVVFGKYLKADLSIYYTLLDNALARRDFSYNGQDSIDYDGTLSRVQAIQNITRAWVSGIQAGIEINPGMGFGLKSTLSFQKGEEQSEDSLKYYPLRHAVPLFGSTHLTYEMHRFRFDFYVEYNAGMDAEDMPLSEITDSNPYAKDSNGKPFVPAWTTLNFKAAWFVNKMFTVNAGIENITDQLYRPYASGISAPGRNFILTLRARF